MVSMKPKSAEELANERYPIYGVNGRSVVEQIAYEAFLAGHASREPEIMEVLSRYTSSYETIDKLTSENAQLKDAYDFLFEKFDHLTAENAQIREALIHLPKAHNVKFYDADNDAVCHQYCAACAALAVLRKYPAHEDGGK